MSTAADRSFAEKAKMKAAAKMEARRQKLKAEDALRRDMRREKAR